ncbi:linker for activation of T-cells family member 1 isoform X2 [Phascolarctos cinereus]
METTSLGPSLLWLLILLFPALLVTALCLCCRDFPGPNSEVSPSDSSYQPSSGLVILKRPYTNTSWPSAVSCQPDLLPIPRSPQHPGLSHRITSRRDADTQPEDADEEDDYHNEGYLEVLPDDCPNSSSAPLSNSAPNLGSPGLRDSPSSSELGVIGGLPPGALGWEGRSGLGRGALSGQLDCAGMGEFLCGCVRKDTYMYVGVFMGDRYGGLSLVVLALTSSSWGIFL